MVLRNFEDELNTIGTRWIEAAESSPRPSPNHLVYHYTNAAGLYGMLSSGKVWLTNYRFLNDKTELTHTQNLASETIRNELRNKPDIVRRLLYNNVLEWLEVSTNIQPYVMSFSEEGDDLSQWRGYANDGEGFTIGFLASAIDECIQSADDTYTTFAKIEYERIAQVKMLLAALKEVEAALRKRVRNSVAERQGLVDEAGRYFDWIAGAFGALNKHHSFRFEKEWRLIVYYDLDSPPKQLPPNVRVSGTKLVPYAEVNLCGIDGKLPIKRIGVGPGFAEGAEADAVRMLCKIHGYEPEIYFADTPYRRPDRIL